MFCHIMIDMLGHTYVINGINQDVRKLLLKVSWVYFHLFLPCFQRETTFVTIASVCSSWNYFLQKFFLLRVFLH